VRGKNPRLAAACDASGMPLDPAHPWNHEPPPPQPEPKA
jgi:hypothetical protein